MSRSPRSVQALIVVDMQAAFVSAELVPHAMVSRVAEWALGDEIDIIARAADLRFEGCLRHGDRS